LFFLRRLFPLVAGAIPFPASSIFFAVQGRIPSMPGPEPGIFVLDFTVIKCYGDKGLKNFM